jgi:NTE family protein
MRTDRRRLLARAAGAALALPAAGLAGCSLSAGIDHRGDDAPRADPLARPVRTAWVLSSGGPRGVVHVGVLKALEELDLAPDLIVGTSAGALVGTMRASGLSCARIERLALGLQPTALARLALRGDEWLSGDPIADLVRANAPVARLEQMPIAMACVAFCRPDAKVVAFTAGDAGLAVQASAAIEGRFAPVRIRGEPFIDADWYMPLPVRVARALGARRVIAVDASAHVDRAPPEAAEYRASDLRKHALVQTDAPLADLLIKPWFGYWADGSREWRERVIAAGYHATLAQAGAIRTLHAG